MAAYTIPDVAVKDGSVEEKLLIHRNSFSISSIPFRCPPHWAQ